MSELSDAVTDLDEVIKRLEARNEVLEAKVARLTARGIEDMQDEIKRLEAEKRKYVDRCMEYGQVIEQLQADYDVLVKISDGYRDEAERLRVITDKYCWSDEDIELALEAGA